MSKRRSYTPKPEIVALLSASGNTINGLGEAEVRQASPFFWHPPHLHPYGDLQKVARLNSRKCPGAAEAFAAAYAFPDLLPVERTPREGTADQFAREARAFALAHEADDFGIAAMDPLFVFKGYEIKDPWVITIALAHDYECLKQLPSDETNGAGVCDVGHQYARGTRASYALANWIRAQGYNATPYTATTSALLMIPAAIAGGLGELGKHGSMISRYFGAGFRLAAVTTDMPLISNQPDSFGADEFCHVCQACTNACPPGAISDSKQMVRGSERWYVDFDRCIPYFAEASSCGVCLAICPWTRPTARPKLLDTMARRLKSGND